MKRIEVIVLNWNGWRDTVACVGSLQRQDYPCFELLVVDNGSSDASVAEIENAIPSVELLRTGRNLGFGGGCNFGIRHAMAGGADYVWLLNNDATADPNALSAMVRVAEADPGVGAVGSVLYAADEDEKIQLWGGGTVNCWLGRSKHRTSAGPIDFISGASVLLRCAALENVGLFDQESFFMYWEDTDLGFRLRKAGWCLAVAEDSRVWHKESASLGKHNPLLDEYFIRSSVRFLKRYAPLPFISIMLMFIPRLVKRALVGDFARVQAVIRGFFDA